jgi:hypothetical protein
MAKALDTDDTKKPVEEDAVSIAPCNDKVVATALFADCYPAEPPKAKVEQQSQKDAQDHNEHIIRDIFTSLGPSPILLWRFDKEFEEIRANEKSQEKPDLL